MKRVYWPLDSSTKRLFGKKKKKSVGKTTLVQKVVKGLQNAGLPCYGFVTQEIRQGGRRSGFDIVTLDGKSAVLSRVKPDSGGKRECRVGQYVVDVPSFESLALPVLNKTSDGHILVLDEIGKMEMFSQKFVSGVRQVMGQSSSTVLTTIPIPKGRPIPLVEEIRNRKDILLINLSRENRDDPNLEVQIIGCLSSSLQKK
ncbi:cancer-related nucleoside-triphosphatase-like isoform X1 [Macrobrachium nipponense]|uniref:cancer-related nucleoside-triphosphatase-like isoform X1 n=1 Tax=Macrobrachium nipponense TaxID=159736 RepID=UPI0030C7DD35